MQRIINFNMSSIFKIQYKEVFKKSISRYVQNDKNSTKNARFH